MLQPKPVWLQQLFPWAQKTLTVNGRTMAFVDEGPPTARPVLLLHGNPTWGFLYRDFIGPLLAAGYRVIVPDWIGAGYSDHPRVDAALTFAHHLADLVSLLDQLRLRGFVNIPRLLQRAARRPLTAAEAKAYGAPFPTPAYQTAALVFPRLVPTHADHPGAYDNRLAMARLKTLTLPVLLPWAAGDPITAPWEAQLRSMFRHAAPALPIAGVGHFLQEDAGSEIAAHIRRWLGAREQG